uniref:Uncharacterized protein n=1 Tax=Timema bartmani TaxID=61472 RepID=A0A7R9EZ27_9NEOP|nr:unnamed protein product [Timema bartmani]
MPCNDSHYELHSVSLGTKFIVERSEGGRPGRRNNTIQHNGANGYCTNQFTISRLLSRITEMSTVSESVAHDVSKPVESIIRQKLTSCLSPVHLEVINESYMHNAPKGSESHFKVVVVSEKFESLPLIKVPRSN